MFFCWWPTHRDQDIRGKTGTKRSVAVKTMRHWWNRLENSAIFIYLRQKHGFDQLSIKADDNSFVDNLLRLSSDRAMLLRLFGSYAYLTETFRQVSSEWVYVKVPKSVARVPISTSSFSDAELEVIGQYDVNYSSMNYS